MSIPGVRPGEKPAPIFAASGLYVTADDALLLTSHNSVAGVAIAIGGRVLDPTGRPVPFSERHVPNTDRTAATSLIRLGDGWLQSVSVGVASGTPIFGQSYVRVDVVRGGGAGQTVLGTLLEGNVSATMRQAWPGSILHGPLERGGALRALTGTDPAANTEISETVPTGARWRLLSMRFALVTDANAANREVAITFDNGTTVYFEAASGANQAASLTRQYTAAVTNVRGAAATGTGILIPLPDLVLLAGHRIATVTTNRQAGDNYGAPLLLVEESLEG
jgi:hypothetical protein